MSPLTREALMLGSGRGYGRQRRWSGAKKLGPACRRVRFKRRSRLVWINSNFDMLLHHQYNFIQKLKSIGPMQISS